MMKDRNLIKMQNYIEKYDGDGNIIGDPLFVWTPIRRVNNTIYFSAEVNEYSQMVLTHYLLDMQASLLADSSNKNCINIIINSPGGYLNSGLALYDVIKSLKVNVHCEVQGTCASAASLILLAADHRTMSEFSVVLIHQLSAGVIGTYQNIEDTYMNTTQAMGMLKEIYLRETLIGFTSDEVNTIRYSSYKNDKSDTIGNLRNNPEIKQRRLAYLDDLLQHDIELCKFDCEKYGIIDILKSIKLDESDMKKIDDLTKELINKKIDKMKEEEFKKNKQTQQKRKSK